MERIASIARVGDSNQITINPSEIELSDGDWVRWIFPDLPSDQFGFVFFLPRFGPFHSLRSFSNTQVLGKGNVGLADLAGNRYDYTAMILRAGEKDPIATGVGTITNKATRVDTAPEVFVTYDPTPGLKLSEAIKVIPDPVSLNPGDTATWYFVNLPEGAFANFLFVPDSLAPSLRVANGPFMDFYACDGSGPVTVRASGTGFAAAPLPENEAWPRNFTYHLEVRNPEGVLIGSHDPVIDNLGVPPTSP